MWVKLWSINQQQRVIDILGLIFCFLNVNFLVVVSIICKCTSRDLRIGNLCLHRITNRRLRFESNFESDVLFIISTQLIHLSAATSLCLGYYVKTTLFNPLCVKIISRQSNTIGW